MFCSSAAEGKFSELYYPSSFWRDRLFRLGAPRANGSVFNWTPEYSITFRLPGVDVAKVQAGTDFSKTLSPGGVTDRAVDMKYVKGSSVATVLAAGFASMIIYCFKASILVVKAANQNKGYIVGIGIPGNGANEMAKHNAMRLAFASLGKVTPNNFIQLWDKPDKTGEILETATTRPLTLEAKLARTEQFVRFVGSLMKRDEGDLGSTKGLSLRSKLVYTICEYTPLPLRRYDQQHIFMQAMSSAQEDFCYKDSAAQSYVT